MKFCSGSRTSSRARGGVAAEIAAELVDLVEHEDGVVGAGAAEGLDDLAGEGADVGAAVAADFGFVVHAAHGDAGELAAEGAGDGAAEGGFAHAGRSDEAEDGAFEDGLELEDGEVVEDAVLDLFEVVVIFVEDFGGALDIDLGAGGGGPGEGGHPLELGAGHAVFGRGRGHAGQAFELAGGLGFDGFGEAGGFEFWRAVLRFRGAASSPSPSSFWMALSCSRR